MLPLKRWSSALPIALFLAAACAPVEALPSTAGVMLLNQPAQAKPAVSAPPRVRPVDPPLSPMVTVRVGMLSQTSDAGLFIANDKGYFREQGLELESIPFQTAQQMVAPLGAGQLDIGGGATSAALLNAVAREVPIRITADKGSTPVGFGFQGLLVRKELVDRGEFTGCSSFKGYRVAVTGPGVSQEPGIEHALADCGLGLGDVTLVPMGFPEMPTAARNGAIDAGMMIEPLLTSSVSSGVFSIYQRTDQFYPNQQIAVLLYAPHIIAEQRAVGERFMLAYVKALRDHWNAFTRGLNKSEILDVLSRHTAVKDNALLQQMTPVGLNPDGYVNMNTFSDDVEWWFTHGYVQRRVDPALIVDNSFVDYAIERLGRYTPW
jgi:ABC-type nitrate/sulfonate/bicarbonate transport system substrate-binding protein